MGPCGHRAHEMCALFRSNPLGRWTTSLGPDRRQSAPPPGNPKSSEIAATRRERSRPGTNMPPPRSHPQSRDDTHRTPTDPTGSDAHDAVATRSHPARNATRSPRGRGFRGRPLYSTLSTRGATQQQTGWFKAHGHWLNATVPDARDAPACETTRRRSVFLRIPATIAHRARARHAAVHARGRRPLLRESRARGLHRDADAHTHAHMSRSNCTRPVTYALT
jgi:hypothetical protein